MSEDIARLIEEMLKKKDPLGALLKVDQQQQLVVANYIERLENNNDIWNGLVMKQLNFAKDEGGVPSTTLTPQERAMLSLTNIFFTIEGALSAIANIIIFSQIVNNHHDIWIEEERRFVSTFEDILKVTLDQKMKFLKSHGYDIIYNVCHRNIRNAVAHNNFTIDSDGNVLIQKKKYTRRELAIIGFRLSEISSLALVGIGLLWNPNPEEFKGTWEEGKRQLREAKKLLGNK